MLLLDVYPKEMNSVSRGAFCPPTDTKAASVTICCWWIKDSVCDFLPFSITFMVQVLPSHKDPSAFTSHPPDKLKRQPPVTGQVLAEALRLSRKEWRSAGDCRVGSLCKLLLSTAFDWERVQHVLQTFSAEITVSLSWQPSWHSDVNSGLPQALHGDLCHFQEGVQFVSASLPAYW